MRIKFDFVTNSSSSSFIVVWPKLVKTLNYVKMFIPKEDKAKQVLSDSIKQNKKLSQISVKDKRLIDKIAEVINSGYLDEIEDQMKLVIEPEDKDTSYISYEDFKTNFQKRHNIRSEEMKDNEHHNYLCWAEYENIRLLLSKNLAIKFCEQHEGHFIYTYDYADGDGSFFSEMEHGGTFNNLPHIRISKH